MKIYNSILALLISFIGVFQANAQESQIVVQSYYDGNSIKLRWAIDDVASWKSLNQHGYIIAREIRVKNGIALSDYESLQTRDTLVAPLLPADAANWAEDDMYARVAKKSLYDTSYDVEVPETIDLNYIRDYQAQEDSKLMFAHFSADQDFEVAKKLALAFEDTDVLSNHKYRYFVIPFNSESNTKFGLIEVETLDADAFAAPTILRGISFDKAIGIEWDATDIASRYMSYDIERSMDGISFETVNEVPFIYFAEGDDIRAAMYVDSVELNKQNYIYRVAGHTPFGTLSMYSDTIHAMAWPDRMDGLYISQAEPIFQSANDAVLLNWSLPEEFTEMQNVASYEIYRSEDMIGQYDLVSEFPLSPSKTSFVDEDPLDEGFYRVVATDINDHVYVSNTELAQKPDTIAPAIPINLTGHYLNKENFELSWDEVTDEDLKGYRVFYSNQRDGNYTQLTLDYISNTYYSGYTDPSIKADSVFVRVLAEDQRSNHSDLSEPLALSRPDNVPPGNPDITQAMPTPEGVRIGWKYSSDEEVTHYLQRKPVHSPSWETLFAIEPEAQDDYVALDPDEMIETLFVDTTELSQEPYQYRMVAEDADFDQSSSSIIEVTPYASNVAGEVEDFDIEVEAETVPANTLVNAKLSGLQEKTGSTRHMSTVGVTYNMQMSWKYEIDETVKDFQILRSLSGQPLEVVKTLSLAEALGYESNDEVSINGSLGLMTITYRDPDLQPGKRYVYQILTRHQAGAYSERSQTLTKKIPKS